MQPSLFGVEATEPTPADLAGLLAGPGELRQMGGTARVRVSVDAGWRVHVLIEELARRALRATWAPQELDQRRLQPQAAGEPEPREPPEPGAEPPEPPEPRAEPPEPPEPPESRAEQPAPPEPGPRESTVEPVPVWFEVRTAYTARLLGLARRWRDGPPPRLHLNGQALRLWVAAAGVPDGDGYLLRVGPGGHLAGPSVAAALRAVGLAADLVPAPDPQPATRPQGRGGLAPGPAYRVRGRRRLALLAELVGAPPAIVPAGHWPQAP